LRARPAAGDLQLGALVEREIFGPFVYRHSVDPGIGSALRELVERARAELSLDPARDLKLGPGGIREAEFFVQALQLVWGGREPSLRVRGTLSALSRLNSRGLVNEREAWTLAEGYAFLRRLEHRVQWTLGVQTHLLPPTRDGLARLGRSLGHADERALLLELDRVRSAVATAFASVSPRSEKRREISRYDVLLSALSDPSRAEGQSEELFDSAEIGDHLVALARRPDSLLGELTRDKHPELARRALEALGSSPDPEQAARYLRTFFGRFSTPTAYVTALAADERALIRLVRALGSSSFVGDALVARPELADVVVFGEGRVSDPRAAVAAEIENQPGPWPVDEQEAEEHFVWALRTAKRRVMLEVAVADLAGAIGTRDATRLLSELADEILKRATERVLAGTPGLTVIALGKLGGRDIGYGSDLDVIFV
jgi:glutamate-ammonia-ligase adenylyltransferase